MGKTKGLTDGAIPVSYIEVVMSVKEMCAGDMNGAASKANELQALVMQQFPEYANKMLEWRTLATLINRVPQCGWTLMEDFMKRHGMKVPPIPQTWLRDACLVYFEYFVFLVTKDVKII